MQDVSVWAQEMSISAANLAGRVIEYLPTILGALLVILAG